MRDENVVLRLEGICKEFPGVKALQNVEFTLRKGEIHALMGENGAGKSTLIKVLTGVYEKDGGNIPQFLREPHDFVQICVGLRNAEECLTVADDINRTFPGTLDAKPNGYSCDITVSGIQKPAGIHRFVETLPEKPEDVITVGDNLNDLSMVREFTGYAIEAGSPKAHSAAGRTVPSVAALIDLLLQ